MNNRGSTVITKLRFKDRILTGLTTIPDEYYWLCPNIFECDQSEFEYNDIEQTTPFELPENAFIYFPCSLDNYQYCDSISIGRIKGELHFRLSISFNLSKWEENLNLRKFFDLLHDDIQQSPNLKVSDCYHDCQDFYLEVEFIGDLNETLDAQVQRVLVQIREFHNYNRKHII